MENKYDEIAQIVADIQAGNDEAFDRLYELTKRMVYFELKSAGVSEADTEDLLQETYIKIYNKIHTIEDVQASYKWIKQLAYRTGINYVKSSIVSHEQLSAEGTDDIFESEDSLTSPLPMPEDIMQNKESQRLVREILQGLPVLQYKMILAYYYNESSVREIAEDFDVPEGTVKTNLFRARAEIKTKVEELEKKHGIKLYTVAALPLFSFFMDTEAQAAQLPAFMQQDVFMKGEMISETGDALSYGQPEEDPLTQANREPSQMNQEPPQMQGPSKIQGGNVPPAYGAAAGGAAAKTGGLSLITKLLIAILASVLVLGTVAVVAVVMNQSEDKKEERSFEREEDDSEFKMTVAKEEKEETEDSLEEDAESIEKQENTEEKEEPEEEKTPLLNHEGEVVVMANNMDGTYTVKISEYVFFDRSYVEQTDIGDEIISPMGDRFILITLQDLYAEYYGEDYTTGGYAAYSLGPEGQKYYYEMEVYGDGYRLLTPDSRAYILDGQQSDGVVVKVAEDAEIMLLGNAMESETIAVEDFVTMNWNGTSGYGRMLPMPASAKIVDGELVFLSQIFVP